MKIDMSQPIVFDGIAQPNSAPRSTIFRKSYQLDSLGCRAYGDELPFDFQMRLRRETNGRPGLDG